MNMKFLIIINLFLTITFLIQISLSARQNHHRQKRFLIFPPTTPTRHQFICGVGVPVGLDLVSVTTGWVLKAQYFLPDNASNLLWSWGSQVTNIHLGKRSLPDNSTNGDGFYINGGEKNSHDTVTDDHVEKYVGHIEQIDFQSLSNDVDIEVDYSKDYVWRSKYVEDESMRNDQSRWMLYKIFEGVLNENNLDGKECLKRVICEAASIKFGHENGLLGDLIHVILSPSSTTELYSHEADEEFDRAEELGKQQKPCEFHYQKCRVSLIDMFSTIL